MRPLEELVARLPIEIRYEAYMLTGIPRGWPDYVVLPAVAAYVRPDHIVELGTEHGISTKLIARGHEPITFYTVDALDRESVVMELRKTMPYLMGIQGDSVAVGKIWDKPVDMLFIDTGHTYELTLEELQTWAPKVRKVILLHDVNTFPAVGVAIHEWLKTAIGWTYELYNEGCGMGVLWRDADPD